MVFDLSEKMSVKCKFVRSFTMMIQTLVVDVCQACYQIQYWHIPSRSAKNDVIKWRHFSVTVPLCGGFTGHRWIHHTEASDVELWCFLWSAPEPTPEQTMGAPVIWDAIALIMTSRWWRVCTDTMCQLAKQRATRCRHSRYMPHI